LEDDATLSLKEFLVEAEVEAARGKLIELVAQTLRKTIKPGLHARSLDSA